LGGYLGRNFNLWAFQKNPKGKDLDLGTQNFETANLRVWLLFPKPPLECGKLGVKREGLEFTLGFKPQFLSPELDLEF